MDCASTTRYAISVGLIIMAMMKITLVTRTSNGADADNSGYDGVLRIGHHCRNDDHYKLVILAISGSRDVWT